jgi:hypothetical protein
VNEIFLGGSNGVELTQEEFDQLGLLFLGDLGQSIDYDEGVIALLKLNLELFAEIRDVDLIFVEVIIVKVSISKMLESRCHTGLRRICGGEEGREGGRCPAAGNGL